MRLTEASLRIDLIGPLLLSQGRTYLSDVKTLEMRKLRSGGPATGWNFPSSSRAHFFPRPRARADWKPVDAQHGVASWQPPLILRDYSFPRCFNVESGRHADTLSHKFAIKVSPGLRTPISLSQFLVLPRQIWFHRGLRVLKIY